MGRRGRGRLWPIQFWPIHYWPMCVVCRGSSPVKTEPIQIVLLLFGWLFSCLVGCEVVWLYGWLLGWSVGRLCGVCGVCRSVVWCVFVGCLVCVVVWCVLLFVVCCCVLCVFLCVVVVVCWLGRPSLRTALRQKTPERKKKERKLWTTTTTTNNTQTHKTHKHTPKGRVGSPERWEPPRVEGPRRGLEGP